MARKNTVATTEEVTLAQTIETLCKNMDNMTVPNNEVIVVGKPEVLVEGLTANDYDIYNRVLHNMTKLTLVNEVMHERIAAQMWIVESKELYKIEGYASTAKWADGLYKLSKSYVSECLKVYRELGNPDMLGALADNWKDYKFSSLITIAGIPKEDRPKVMENISPTLSRAQIKEAISTYYKAIEDKEAARKYVKVKALEIEGLKRELSKLMSAGELNDLIASVIPTFFTDGGFDKEDGNLTYDKEAANKLYIELSAKLRELRKQEEEEAEEEGKAEEGKAEEGKEEEGKAEEGKKPEAPHSFPVVKINRNKIPDGNKGILVAVSEILAKYQGQADILITSAEGADWKYAIPTELENKR